MLSTAHKIYASPFFLQRIERWLFARRIELPHIYDSTYIKCVICPRPCVYDLKRNKPKAIS